MTWAQRLATVCLLGLAASATWAVPHGLVQKATAALESGDLDKAEQLYGELRSDDPDDALGWLGGALVARARGDLNQAVEFLARARELAPENPGVELARAQTLAQLGALEPALAALARLRELDPQRPDGHLLAALLLRDTERTTEAIAILEEATQSGPEDPRIWMNLGSLYLAEGKIQRALRTAQAAVKKFPEELPLTLLFGLSQARSPEHADEAIQNLEQVLKSGLDGPTQRMELGQLLIAKDRAGDAAVHLERAAELVPRDPEPVYLLAQSLRRQGRTGEAEAAFARFRELRVQIDLDDAEAQRRGRLLSRAIEQSQNNQLEEALATVDELLEEVPGHARALAFRAKVLFSLGRISAGHQAAVAARTGDPSIVEHHYLEGRFLFYLDRLEDAAVALEWALKLDPALGEAHEILAIIAFRQEKPGVSVEHFERALHAGVDSVELRATYALALRAAGREDEGLEQLELIKDRLP